MSVHIQEDKMKKFVEEFKEFISKGNVLDLAVGVVIGGAFTAIVNSLVNDVIMPLVGIVLGGVDFSGLSLQIGEASLAYGNFIQAVINFLLVALVLFSIIKAANKFKKQVEEAPAEPSDEVKLLTSIEEELKKLNKK